MTLHEALCQLMMTVPYADGRMLSEVKEIIRPVKVVEIAEAHDTRPLSYSGSLRARTESALAFRVHGKITERLVDIGQHVAPGDVLARIDPTDYDLSVKSAQAALDAAERQVETTELARKRAEPAERFRTETVRPVRRKATRDAAARRAVPVLEELLRLLEAFLDEA